jgi:hypothetical protein
MAQYTSEDKEISDLDSHETIEFISAGASNHDLESYVHKRFKDLQLEEAPSHEEGYVDFLRERGKIYEEALGKARPLIHTRSEAEREEYVRRIEDLLVWNMVSADINAYRQGEPACGRIECWAARQKFVNIVVALIRGRGADDPNSGTEVLRSTPISKELLVLAIAAEKNDHKMVEALKDIAVADESFDSREPDLHSRGDDLFDSDWNEPLYLMYPRHSFWLCPIEAAARMGHVDMVTRLIALQEVKIKSIQERQEKKASEMVMKNEFGEATMKQGLSTLMRDEKSKCRRAFDWAVRMGRHEVVQLLIDRDYIVDFNEAFNVRRLLDNADVG